MKRQKGRVPVAQKKRKVPNQIIAEYTISARTISPWTVDPKTITPWKLPPALNYLDLRIDGSMDD